MWGIHYIFASKYNLQQSRKPISTRSGVVMYGTFYTLHPASTSIPCIITNFCKIKHLNIYPSLKKISKYQKCSKTINKTVMKRASHKEPISPDYSSDYHKTISCSGEFSLYLVHGRSIIYTHQPLEKIFILQDHLGTKWL